MTAQISRPRRSRIAQFKTPFIVSVAGSAALGLACGGRAGTDDPGKDPGGSALTQTDAGVSPPVSTTARACKDPQPATSCGTLVTCVDGEWIQSAGWICNPPPPPACPESLPDVGTSCAGQRAESSCDYPYCYGSAPMRRCNGSTWLWEALPLFSCNPPAPEPEPCAPAMPVAGSDCTLEEQICRYDGCQGPASSSATCRFGQWLVQYSIGAACNPPAVVPVCPERQPVHGEGCAYDDQVCPSEPCSPGAESRNGFVCTPGGWQGVLLSCPPDAGPPDGGI